MIIFDLCCEHEHRFEGWFQSCEDFDSQSASRLIACPECASLAVRRVPSMVHLGSQPRRATAPTGQTAAAARPSGDPRADVLFAYRALTARLLADCEDVGAAFAEEARKIHYLEAPERSIRGEASSEEFEALRDEGIDVFCLPLLKVKDLH